MEWKGQRGSRNIEDRRGSSMGRRVGISGVGAVVVLLPGLFLGVDVSPLPEGSGYAPGGPVEVTAQDRAAG
jgi:predicted metalloprotease